MFGENGVENIGIAVFRDDKLVGELTALETLCLSIIQKKVNSFLIRVPDNKQENETIDVTLYTSRRCKTKVDIINGSPLITVKCNLSGRIYSMHEDSKYLDDRELKNISYKVNKYLEDVFSDYLYKTSLELKSDINGFGKFCAKNFLTTKEFENYDWQNNYQNSIFKIKINSDIESGFLVTET